MAAPNPPSQITSAGGKGTGGMGIGRVSVVAPPKKKPWPWPNPESSLQGGVGGAGDKGTVSVSAPPYYGPFNMYWPYQVPRSQGLPNNPIRL